METTCQTWMSGSVCIYDGMEGWVNVGDSMAESTPIENDVKSGDTLILLPFYFLIPADLTHASPRLAVRKYISDINLLATRFTLCRFVANSKVSVISFM